MALPWVRVERAAGPRALTLRQLGRQQTAQPAGRCLKAHLSIPGLPLLHLPVHLHFLGFLQVHAAMAAPDGFHMQAHVPAVLVPAMVVTLQCVSPPRQLLIVPLVLLGGCT